MKAVKLKSLLAFAMSGVLVFASAPGLASATLAGENGPIVYIEETETEVCDEPSDEIYEIQPMDFVYDECYEQDVTQVVTTTPNGENPVVAAEIVDGYEGGEEITTATISPNDAVGNHTIVFASENDVVECQEYVEDINAEALSVEGARYEDGYCYYMSNAVIYKVVIDKNGNPISEPEVVTTVTGPENSITSSNYYIELSYAPDQKTVVGLRFYYAEPHYDYVSRSDSDEQIVWDDLYGPKHVIERITLANGTVEQLVGPKFDPFMNVGYAQNGAIYFTQIMCETFCEYGDYEYENGNEEPQSWNSDVWVFAPGSSVATQLTNTPEINEYFLSVSPDSKTLLVCDPTTALYYTVNTSNGEVTALTIEDVENPFLPLFFSPDGKSYLGTIGGRFGKHCSGAVLLASQKLLSSVVMSESTSKKPVYGTARASLNDFKNAQVINGMLYPDDWAPIVKASTTTTTTATPQVLGSTTTKKVALQSTGSSMVLVIATGLGLSILAGLTMLYRKQEN